MNPKYIGFITLTRFVHCRQDTRQKEILNIAFHVNSVSLNSKINIEHIPTLVFTCLVLFRIDPSTYFKRIENIW